MHSTDNQLLTVDSLAERRNIPGFKAVSTACFVVGLLLAALCHLLARRLQSELKAYVFAVRSAACAAGA